MSKTLGVNWGFEKTVTGTGSGLIDGNRVFGLNTGITSADPSAVTSGLDGAATSAAGAIGSSNIVAGIVRQFSGAALQVQLNALESDNKTQTIASPSVVTLNNVEARIERRTSSFLLSGSNDTASFEEIDVGLKLAITPMVIPREDAAELELVRLGISLDNTALAAGTGNVVGTASGQTVQTEIIMPTGRTYMIGGLMDDARTKTVQGVPGLKDLPLIGGLFQTDTNTDNFDETIFFITARVVYPQDIVARDVAERRYLRGRQLSLAGTRLDVQSNSATLENRIAFQEDDE
jgi:type II secretory pathway component GspD/PulD (secretin)